MVFKLPCSFQTFKISTSYKKDKHFIIIYKYTVHISISISKFKRTRSVLLKTIVENISLL